MVNIAVDRADLSDYHWTYFYDRDYTVTRLSFPHMYSPHNVPPGHGSMQAEVYFSDKYRPLDKAPEDLAVQLGIPATFLTHPSETAAPQPKEPEKVESFVA